jgi:pimeloyl-ACP methyl ester carboxylesterase
MLVTANGVDLQVEVHGDGEPVLLVHGWPDDHGVWRNQVPALTGAGYRVIVPDLRGFGRSSRPEDVTSYKLANSAADMAAVLKAAGVQAAHVVGHDWGSAVAWATAMFQPACVRTLTVISTPHLGVPDTPRQREMAWYTLFFQFPGIAEAQLTHDDWALFRELAPGYKDLDRAIANLSRPGAPAMGVWSDGDRYLDGARMRASGDLVKGPWRYEEITGAGHWIPLDAPEELNALLLDWLGSAT